MKITVPNTCISFHYMYIPVIFPHNIAHLSARENFEFIDLMHKYIYNKVYNRPIIQNKHYMWQENKNPM